MIGKKIAQIHVRLPFTPSVNNDKNTITGKVIYIDNYENVITNISEELFLEIGQGRALRFNSAITKSNKWFVPMQK